MTIDKMNMGCMPLWYSATPPPDQQKCIIEACETCKCQIWVSIKKREYRARIPTKMICLLCLAKLAVDTKKAGHDFELVDILDPKH